MKTTTFSKTLMRMFFIAALVLGSIFQTKAATFNITYDGVPTEAQTAIEYAANIWGGLLVSDVPISVHISWFDLSGNYYAYVVPNGAINFSGAPYPDTWYTLALANSIAGVDLKPGEDNFDIVLDSETNWYYGTDGNPGADQEDLVSAVLHGFANGLGFISLSKRVDQTGSFGMIQQSDILIPLTFPFPDLNGFPGAFDRFLYYPPSGQLIDMDNQSVALGDAMVSNNIYFNGPITVAGNNGVSPKIYAPAEFKFGASLSTLDEDTYPAGDPNAFMTPVLTYGEAIHVPGPICLNVLKDIGWTIDLGVQDVKPRNRQLRLYPNPAHSFATLQTAAGFGHYKVYDDLGRALLQGKISGNTTRINVSKLSAGVYFISVKSGALKSTAKLIIAH